MIGSTVTQTSLEDELYKFQEKMSKSLATALSNEMNQWLVSTAKLIEVEPELKSVLFTNL